VASNDVSKHVWKFQEGSVVLALQSILSNKRHIHWHFTPFGMSIDPDIVIGDNPDSPAAVIFVTHASAERASEKKMWRTISEVLEAKRLKSSPKVFSILFSGSIKLNILEAYKSLFDAVYHLEESGAGNEITKYLNDQARTHIGLEETVCLKVLEKDISTEAFPYWHEYLKEIEILLAQKKGDFHDVMTSKAYSRYIRAPKARKTYFRRYISALLSFPSKTQHEIITGAQPSNLPEHANIFRWGTKTIAGNKIIDEGLIDFVKTTSTDDIIYLLKYAENNLDQLMKYVGDLNNISVMIQCGDWLLDNFELLSTREGMEASIESVFNNPGELLSHRVQREKVPTYHWLVQLIMILLRTETGRKDGYGYSVMAKEMGYTTSGHRLAQPGLVLAPFIQLQKSIPKELLNNMAKIFSGHMSRLGVKKISSLLKHSTETFCNHVYRYQIGTYRYLNPIEWLVCRSFDENGIEYCWPTDHKSFISPDVSGRTSSTGNMIVAFDNRIWVKCQSAYDGKTDKRKELCGRIGAMKLSYSADKIKGLSFFLVVDGEFNDTDLQLLSEAGWDGIYYYDEVDLLLKDINSLNLQKTTSKL
jgi:hypothetical protein